MQACWERGKAVFSYRNRTALHSPGHEANSTRGLFRKLC